MNPEPAMPNERPTIAIIGAGFGGLRAARQLRRAKARVVLIDRRNYHLFQPLLYQVATAGLEPEQIAKPVRAILRGQRNFEFRLAEVQSIDLAARSLHTSSGDVGYDYLILAAGSATDTFGKPGIEKHAIGLKDLSDAVAIRNRILCLFERATVEPHPAVRRALLTLVVVGGGPTGVEMAGALSELVHLVLAKDLPALDLSQVSIVLLEAADRLLPGMPAQLSAAAAATLERKGVRVRLGAPVDDYDGEALTLRGGEIIPTKTVIWAAGARAAPLAARLGIPTGRQGRIPVEPTLQLRGAPEAFVIGDAAYLEDAGQPLPMMAPVAVQMADAAVDNIRRLLRGESALAFRYQNPGSLATIGRNAAVAHLYGRSFQGFAAWVVWLVVHLIQLIGFRNRLFVLVNWAVDYFFYDRAVRLITEDDAPC
jgi:NADH dehydrogenase